MKYLYTLFTVIIYAFAVYLSIVLKLSLLPFFLFAAGIVVGSYLVTTSKNRSENFKYIGYGLLLSSLLLVISVVLFFIFYFSIKR